MRKTFIFTAIVAALVLSAIPVLAQEDAAAPATNTNTGVRSGTIKEAQKDIRDLRQGVKAEIKDIKAGMRGAAVEEKKAIIQQVKEKREAEKEAIKQKREALKANMEAKKEELKSKIQIKRDELKQRLEKVKDERKKNIVEKVDNQLRELNENRIKHFTAVLEKLEDILARVVARADKAETNGGDVSNVKTAVKTAEDAIAVARLVIETQAGKIYSVTVNTEDTLKKDVGQARQVLHSDLTKVKDSVSIAREATQKAIQSLKDVPAIPASATSTPETSQ
jgi:DNA repair exonuclease SbcCD ATPase subunit